MAGLQSQNISIVSSHFAGHNISIEKSTCVFCRRRAFALPSDPHAPIFAFFSLVDCRHYACQPCALVNCDNAGRFIECPQCHCSSRLAQSGMKRSASARDKDEAHRARVAIDDGVSSVASHTTIGGGSSTAKPRSALKDHTRERGKRAHSVQFSANQGTSSSDNGEPSQELTKKGSPLTPDVVATIPSDPTLVQRQKREQDRVTPKVEAEPSVGLYSLTPRVRKSRERSRSEPAPSRPKKIMEPPSLTNAFPQPPPLVIHTVEAEEAECAKAIQNLTTKESIAREELSGEEALERKEATRAASMEQELTRERLLQQTIRDNCSACEGSEADDRSRIVEVEAVHYAHLVQLREECEVEMLAHRVLHEELNISPCTPAGLDISDMVSVTSDDDSLFRSARSRRGHLGSHGRHDSRASEMPGCSAESPSVAPQVMTSELTEARAMIVAEVHKAQVEALIESETSSRAAVEQAEAGERRTFMLEEQEALVESQAQDRQRLLSDRAARATAEREMSTQALVGGFVSTETAQRLLLVQLQEMELHALKTGFDSKCKKLNVLEREHEQERSRMHHSQAVAFLFGREAVCRMDLEQQYYEEYGKVRSRYQQELAAIVEATQKAAVREFAFASRELQAVFDRLTRLRNEEHDERWDIIEGERQSREWVASFRKTVVPTSHNSYQPHTPRQQTLQPMTSSNKQSRVDFIASYLDSLTEEYQMERLQLVHRERHEWLDLFNTHCKELLAVKVAADAAMRLERECQQDLIEVRQRQLVQLIRQLSVDEEEERYAIERENTAFERQLRAIEAQRELAKEEWDAHFREESSGRMMLVMLEGTERHKLMHVQHKMLQESCRLSENHDVATSERARQMDVLAAQLADLAHEENTERVLIVQLERVQRLKGTQAFEDWQLQSTAISAQQKAEELTGKLAMVANAKLQRAKLLAIDTDELQAREELRQEEASTRACLAAGKRMEFVLAATEEAERLSYERAELRRERMLEQLASDMQHLTVVEAEQRASVEQHEGQFRLKLASAQSEEAVRARQAGETRQGREAIREQERHRRSTLRSLQQAMDDVVQQEDDNRYDLRREESDDHLRIRRERQTHLHHLQNAAMKESPGVGSLIRAASISSIDRNSTACAHVPSRMPPQSPSMDERNHAHVTAHTPSFTTSRNILRETHELEEAKHAELLEAQARLQEAEQRMAEEAQIRAQAQAAHEAAVRESQRLLMEAEQRAEDRIRRAREVAEKEAEERIDLIRNASERRAAHEAVMRTLAEEQTRAVLEAKLQAAERALEDAQQRAADDVRRTREEAMLQAAAEAARIEEDARKRAAEYDERRQADELLRAAEREADKVVAERRLREIEERASEAIRAAKDAAQRASDEAQKRVDEMQARQVERSAELLDARKQVYVARERVREFEAQRKSAATSPIAVRRELYEGHAPTVITATPLPTSAPTHSTPFHSHSVTSSATQRAETAFISHVQDGAGHVANGMPVVTAQQPVVTLQTPLPAMENQAPDYFPHIIERLIRGAIREAVAEIVSAKEEARVVAAAASREVYYSERRLHRQLARHERAAQGLHAANSVKSSSATPDERDSLQFNSSFFDESQVSSTQLCQDVAASHRHAKVSGPRAHGDTSRHSRRRSPSPAPKERAGDGHRSGNARVFSDSPLRRSQTGTHPVYQPQHALPQPNPMCPRCFRSGTTSPCWTCGEAICRRCGLRPGVRNLCCSAHLRDLKAAASRKAAARDEAASAVQWDPTLSSAGGVSKAQDKSTSPLMQPNVNRSLLSTYPEPDDAVMDVLPLPSPPRAANGSKTNADRHSMLRHTTTGTTANHSGVSNCGDKGMQQSQSSHHSGEASSTAVGGVVVHEGTPTGMLTPRRNPSFQSHQSSAECTREDDSPLEPKTVRKPFPAFFVPLGETAEPRRPKPPTPCNHGSLPKAVSVPYLSRAAKGVLRHFHDHSHAYPTTSFPSRNERRTMTSAPIAYQRRRTVPRHQHPDDLGVKRPQGYNSAAGLRATESSRSMPPSNKPHLTSGSTPLPFWEREVQGDVASRYAERSAYALDTEQSDKPVRARGDSHTSPRDTRIPISPRAGNRQPSIDVEGNYLSDGEPPNCYSAEEYYYDNLHALGRHNQQTRRTADERHSSFNRRGGEIINIKEDMDQAGQYNIRSPEKVNPWCGGEQEDHQHPCASPTKATGYTLGAAHPVHDAFSYPHDSHSSLPQGDHHYGSAYQYFSARTAATMEELDRRLRQLRKQQEAAEHPPRARRLRTGERRGRSQYPPPRTTPYDPSITVVLDPHTGRSVVRSHSRQPFASSCAHSGGRRIMRKHAVSPPWRTDLNSSPIRPQWNYKQPRSPLYRPPARGFC